MRVRPRLVGLAALILVQISVSATVAPCSASVTVWNAPGIRVVPPEEVLREHVHEGSSGGLWFQHPDGHRVPLVLSTADPQIRNRGDGTFHPADVNEVVAAIETLPPSLVRGLEVQIFVLPFPRSGLLASSADDEGVYLSPGVLEYTPAQIHFLVGHELGHSFHRTFLPDSDGEGWRRYRELRGITDPDRFRAGADHAYRPHEIFAEDFRVLFAGPLGRGDGSVENREVVLPEAVPELPKLLRDLAGGAPGPLPWVAYPNPLRPGEPLRLRGGEGRITDALLIDASGRQVAALLLHPGPVGEWRLQTSELQTLRSGAYWLRVALDQGTVTVPLRWVR